MATNSSTTPVAPDRVKPDYWLQEYGDYLFRYAMLRIRDTHISEEIVQDTFVAAYQSKERFEGRSSERTWLVGILKRKIIEHLRKVRREEGFPEEWLQTDQGFDQNGHWDLKAGTAPRDWENDPSLLFSRRLLQRALQHCILQLPPRFGDVFVLRELEDLQTNEICQLLEITPANCWVILHRVRHQLRSCLERAGFGLGVGSG